jgi:hypothetical protein
MCGGRGQGDIQVTHHAVHWLVDSFVQGWASLAQCTQPNTYLVSGTKRLLLGHANWFSAPEVGVARAY